MKTAMIKTSLWDDDTFYELNIDTKLIYMLVLTAPERGVGRVFKMSDRMISARSGLSIDQISICKKQLEEKGVVTFYKGWINLTEKSSFVQPIKGKLTSITLDREIKEIPNDIRCYFYQSFTGETPVHDNDNVKDKDDVKDNRSKPEINKLFSLWEKIVGYEIDSNKQKNRYACSNLFKKHGIDKLEQLLRGVAMSQTDKYAPRISDFVSLQSKLSELLAWEKRQTSIIKPLNTGIKYKTTKELGMPDLSK